MTEMPSITASSYTTSTTDASDWLAKVVAHPAQIANMGLGQFHNPLKAAPLIQQAQEATPMSTARIVKVFIADSNDNLPLEKRVIYSGDEKLTDLTDQELFFDVPIAGLLAEHNELRKTTVDKKQAEKFGRDIFLEPARIRDLKMVVVTVAQF